SKLRTDRPVESLEELRSIAAQHQREVPGGNEDGDHTRETYQSLKARVTAVLQRYRGYRKVIVVTHGMVIHCMTGKVGIPHCSIHEIEI
ncbi:MAG: histidine phosphatase family protein, partial [Clostridia bacterium]